MTAPLVDIRDLRIQFQLGEGAVEAVKGVSLAVAAGRTLALVGESGSGKTVLSQAMLRLLPPAATISSGRILLHDPARPGVPPVDIAGLAADGRAMRAIRGRRISIVFQEPMTSLSPLHTVGDQVGEALLLHRRCSRAEGRELAIDMLRLVGFPDPRRAWRSYPFELSGGLRQRAMIAMALVCRPALLIADEPTTALDVTIQAQILKLIADLQAELGMAVLMIAHDLGVVANVAEDMAVMYHGRIVERGAAGDLFHHPRHPYLQGLLAAVPRFGMKPGERLRPLREIAPVLPRRAVAGGAPGRGEPLLTVENVTLRFGGVQALAGVGFTIASGEICAIIGPNGAGKTSMLNVLNGAYQPTGGAITFKGRVRRRMRPREAAVAGIARTFQNVALFKGMSTLDNVMAGRNLKMRSNFLACLLPAGPAWAEEARHRAAAEEVIRFLEIDSIRDTPVGRLPYGLQKRVELARALAAAPDLLLLDEPMAGMNAGEKAEMCRFILDTKARFGTTIALIEHDMGVVMELSDHIVVLDYGRKIADGSPGEVRANQAVIDAYLGVVHGGSA